MSSTGEERSLASGIPIPQWMRNKTETYRFDPSALSPPQHEGDFFYIKLPKTQPPEPSNNVKSLQTVLEGKEQAFINHTESCKQFIPKIQETVHVKKPKIIKPMGVDDGFKGEGAACGSSVVEVAHQMLSSKSKSFKLPRNDTEGNLVPPASYLTQQRDSKSLPASPLGSPESSPRTARKNFSTFQNRLFGGTLFSTDNLNKSDDEDIDKKSGSWILSGLFAAREQAREAIEQGREALNDRSVMVAEVDSKKAILYKEDNSDHSKELLKTNVGVQSVSSLSSKTNQKVSLLKSKPHLRDLNLLSPSSM